MKVTREMLKAEAKRIYPDSPGVVMDFKHGDKSWSCWAPIGKCKIESYASGRMAARRELYELLRSLRVDGCGPCSEPMRNP